MIGNILLPVGIGLLMLALVLLILLINEYRSRRRRLMQAHQEDLGLPAGELVYEDADGQGEPLTSDQYPLVGKPDYIVKLGDGRLVPVELKLNVHDAKAPYSNHEVQIAAYCLILEDYSDVPPTHGILRYADREFTVDYTPALRRKVVRLLNEMQQCNEQQAPPLKRQKAAKCRACVYQPICPVGRDK
jgi:CRISPR-associated exonuclease Cas4